MAQVLIIDDDPYVAKAIESHLTDEGYEVRVAHRAEEGMARAMENAPDIILLDVILPDATGFQMCNRFRQTAATKSVPIIMMSGVAKNANQQGYAFERGANEFVHKPIEIIELGHLVHRYVKAVPPQTRALGMLRPEPPAPPREGLSAPLEKLRSLLKKAVDSNPPKPQK